MIPAGVRRAMVTSAIYNLLLPIKLRLEYRAWRARGRTGPSPRLVKHEMVRGAARKHDLHTLVETGTYLGTMVSAVKDDFESIFSIELDPTLATRAMKRFANVRHVSILQGDSANRLADVLKVLRKPALFWLDAHFSGGATASAGSEGPILRELELIANHPDARRHSILIDDSRLFNGTEGYPTNEVLLAVIRARLPHHEVVEANDVLAIEPAPILERETV